MIRIHKSRIEKLDGISRLSAEISINGRRTLLWFAVDASHEHCLSVGRADAFLMALFPIALQERLEILCEDPLSERLCYQLGEYLAPALSVERGGPAHLSLKITAPLTTAPYPSNGAVGFGFSKKKDFHFTDRQRSGENEYPPTYLLVSNTETGRRKPTSEKFQNVCRKAITFARKRNLETLLIDTNLGTFFSKPIKSASTYRELACALAMQGLLSVYLYPPKKAGTKKSRAGKRHVVHDLLLCSCASTETIAIYPAQTEAIQKKQLPTGNPLQFPNNSQSKISNIHIGMPYLKDIDGQAQLCAPVILRGENKTLWFSVDKKYAPYFITERADAFVVALLTTAMREGQDIVCDAPVTERLLYQLNRLLIPIMVSNMREYHPITIYAKAAFAPIASPDAVGTGWTGGVDSLFTVSENLRAETTTAYRLTHLMIANNGAIEGIASSDILKKMGEKAAQDVLPALDLDLLCIDSNLHIILPENFLAVSSIRHAATILALQKLFKCFLVSSSVAHTQFSFHFENIALYEIVVLSCLTTDCTAFYSAGHALTRIQKLMQLSESPLAWRFLHPCIYALQNNCGVCGKCIRTQTALYALGTLDRFSAVFDIAQFYKNRMNYLADVISRKRQTPHYDEIVKTCQENGIDLKDAKRQAWRLKLRRGFKAVISIINK